MLQVGQNQSMTNMALLLDFIQRCLEINLGNGSDYMEGVPIVSIIIVLFENMQGKLDNELPRLLGFVLNDLDHQETLGEEAARKYKSMLLQAISMSFAYNS